MLIVRKLRLEIIAFVSGAVVMTLELVGSRLFAPFVGSSLSVWTSLIGVILGSLSLGYWWGGKLADKNPRYETLSHLLLAAASCVLVAILLHDEVLIIAASMSRDVRLVSVFSAVVLFLPASVVLGAVSPYIVRLALSNVKHSGEVVGRIYAVSTIGSITGTFATGFYLLSVMGSRNALYLLVFTLLILSVVASSKSWKLVTLIGIATSLLLMRNTMMEKDSLLSTNRIFETQYNSIRIVDGTDKDGRQIRVMRRGINTSSAMYLHSDELVFPYTHFYDLLMYYNPHISDALMIGGAAYSYPKWFLQNTDAKIDVVEIDPGTTRLAYKYFDLHESPRLRIYHTDGRVFLNTLQHGVYDAIYIDAYSSLYEIPFQLVTFEAAQLMYDALEDEGVLAANIISSLEGKAAAFLHAEYATYASVFPIVEVYPVDTHRPEQVQNIMLIARKTPQDEHPEQVSERISAMLSMRWDGEIHSVDILTDDYAPVDHLISGSISEARRR